MMFKKAARHVSRAIQNHSGQGHRLRVQVIPDCDGDLELYCVFCGHTLMMGSPAVINSIADGLRQQGFEVVKVNNPVVSVRVH